MRPHLIARFIALLLAFYAGIAHAHQVTLAWDPSPDAATPGRIAGYKLYYSQESFTNISPRPSLLTLSLGIQTSVIVSNLNNGLTYFFGLTSVASDGVESDLSNIITYTTPGTGPGGEEIPPTPDTETPGGVTTDGGQTGETGDTGETGETGSSEEPKSSSPGSGGGLTEAELYGQLPRLYLYSTNGHPALMIAGTLGATFELQSSTEPWDLDSWLTVTNIKLTTAAAEANPDPVNSLERAFVPAMESWEDTDALTGEPRFYRIIMPLGYSIVASQVLTEQGYDTRLIAVRLPGTDAYIVCYVTPEAAYLDYNSETYVVKLTESGATIREIANKVAASLTQNWTSASEFSVTDGTKQILATVVQADDPSLDPPLGVFQEPSNNITIDF